MWKVRAVCFLTLGDVADLLTTDGRGKRSSVRARYRMFPWKWRNIKNDYIWAEVIFSDTLFRAELFPWVNLVLACKVQEGTLLRSTFFGVPWTHHPLGVTLWWWRHAVEMLFFRRGREAGGRWMELNTGKKPSWSTPVSSHLCTQLCPV